MILLQTYREEEVSVGSVSLYTSMFGPQQVIEPLNA